MSDHSPDPTEDQIRRALRARANETTVSPNAMDDIERQAARRSWARPVGYSAVAAVVVLIAGIALLNLPDDDPDVVNEADTTTTVPDYPTDPTTTSTTAPDTAPTTSVPAPPADGVNQGGLGEPLAADPSAVLAAGLELWRDDAITDADALATAYATTQLGIEDPSLSETTIGLESSTIGTEIQSFGVHRRAESGDIMESFAFKIVVAVDDRGPAVTHVVSDSFRIDIVEENSVGSLRITGGGVAFEGTAVLRVEDVGETLISVGGVEFDQFSVIVPRPADDGPVTVLIEGTTVADNEVPEFTAYRTVPVATQTTLSVFGVADDDVLNVRDGAGVSNEIVYELAPDATGLVPTGATEVVDDDSWWEIDADGQRGWVNSRYLVTRRPPPPSLLDWVNDLMLQDGLDPSALANQSEFGGIGVFADFPTPWTAIDRNELGELHNWSPDGTDDRSCDCELTVEEFLGFDTAEWELAEYTIGTDVAIDDPNFFYSVGLPPEFFDRFTTATAFIPEPNPQDSLDWRRYTVVIDFVDGSPTIRGIWRWGWTP